MTNAQAELKIFDGAHHGPGGREHSSGETVRSATAQHSEILERNSKNIQRQTGRKFVERSKETRRNFEEKIRTKIDREQTKHCTYKRKTGTMMLTQTAVVKSPSRPTFHRRASPDRRKPR